MSSSPIKNYKYSELIKNHLLKLKSLKEKGLIKVHELVQMNKLENDLIDAERSESNKPSSIFPKG